MENKALIMAKWYLEIGWSLIPIVSQTKQPAVKWTEFQTRKATYTEVEEWLKKGFFLAVVTGDISGIVVIDDDRLKHGLKEWGFESPIISKSENKGKHFYHLYDRELHSHSNTTLRIDLKGWHSYCLVPPFNGREWINKPTRENLSKLTPLDDDTIRFINSDTKGQNGEKKKVVLTDLLYIGEGARTDSLHRIACSLFTKHSEKETLQILAGINQTYNPPLNQKEFDYQVTRAREFTKTKNKNVDLTSSSGESRERLILSSTGFKGLDALINQIRSGGTYIFAGEEKSGKTSLILNILAHWVSIGHKVFYGSTEMQRDDVAEYLYGITDEKDWFDKNSNFDFFDLGEAGNFNNHLKFLEEKLANELRIAVIDNLTSYRDFSDIQGNSEWEKISFAGDCYRRLARKWNAIIILVVHLNQGGKLREIPKDIKKMITKNQPGKIFNESITVYRRPDTSDIKGGSGFRSQTQGQFLLWRPYQQFNAENLNKLALLIVENNRFGPTGDVPLFFDGVTKTFSEPIPEPSISYQGYEPEVNEDEQLELERSIN